MLELPREVLISPFHFELIQCSSMGPLLGGQLVIVGLFVYRLDSRFLERILIVFQII